QEKADEAEQVAEGEHREDDPDRMQPDALADQLGRDDVALDELAEQEDRDYADDPLPVGPELRDRHARADHQPGERADIGHEGDQAGDDADQQCKMQPDEPERDRIVEAEEQANDQLPAHKAGDRSVNVAYDLAHVVAMAHRYPAVQNLQHPMPVG